MDKPTFSDYIGTILLLASIVMLCWLLVGST